MELEKVMEIAFLQYERQIEQGRSNVQEFAKWLDIPISTVSHLVNGNRDAGKHTDKLARKLSELNYRAEDGTYIDFKALVYKASGRDEPMPDDPLLREALRKFRTLTPEQQKWVLGLIEKKSAESRTQQTSRFQPA